MRLIFFTCFLLCAGLMNSYGQNQRQDSTMNELEKKAPAEDMKKKESFGEMVQGVGLGLWKRVKYRLNLDELADELVEKKDKFIGKNDENEETNKEKKSDEKRPPKKE